MKVGMLPLWDQWGERHATTVLHLDTCQVVQVKTMETEGYTALKLGVGQAKLSRVNITTAGQYKKAGLDPNRKLMEFRVTPDSILPVGTKIQAMHFIPGQVSLMIISSALCDISVKTTHPFIALCDISIEATQPCFLLDLNRSLQFKYTIEVTSSAVVIYTMNSVMSVSRHLNRMYITSLTYTTPNHSA